MMELNDNEFDATFRKRVFNADPQFEEAAWDKMEQKLNRRDRVVFFRKAGTICLLLLIGFVSFLLLDKEDMKTHGTIVKKNNTVPVIKAPDLARPAVKINIEPGIIKVDRALAAVKTRGVIVADSVMGKQEVFKQEVVKRDEAVLSRQNSSAAVIDKRIDSASYLDALPGSDVAATALAPVVKKQKSNRRNSLPVSLSLSAGPEFNSSAAMVGGKAGFSGGIGVSIGVFKRISLQTGLKYSMKDYASSNYAYSFKTEKVRSIVSEIAASCAVLEIPLIASYHLMADNRRSIDINAGISSYIMLNEDYIFKYTAESGLKDREQHFSGKNQHYFGVVDLSATYYVKLKMEKFKLGLEPFVKIPLTGVGEGKVNLKSSGVSLKLRYDLGKKIN